MNGATSIKTDRLMKTIITIPALGDNYIYLCSCADKTVFVIDPADATVVLDFINKHNLTLKAALLTHYHTDHIGGVKELAEKTNCEVIGPDKNKLPV